MNCERFKFIIIYISLSLCKRLNLNYQPIIIFLYIKLCIHNNIYVPWIYNNIYNLYKSISRSTLRENFRQGTKEKRRKEKKKRWSSYTRKRVVQQGRSVTIDYLCRWRRPATVKLKAGIEGLLHVRRYTRFRILSFHGAKWAVIVRNVGDIFLLCAVR